MNLYFNTTSSVFLNDPTLENIVWKWVNPATKVAKAMMSATGEPIPPSYGTRVNPEISVDVLTLGDGYEQVTEAGIRPIRKKLSLVFAGRRPEVTRALDRFFGGDLGTLYDRRPSEWFYFKVPFPFDDANAQPRKFRCQQYSIEPVTYQSNTVSAEFVESFEP